jgi:hypothetical protein
VLQAITYAASHSLLFKSYCYYCCCCCTLSFVLRVSKALYLTLFTAVVHSLTTSATLRCELTTLCAWLLLQWLLVHNSSSGSSLTARTGTATPAAAAAAAAALHCNRRVHWCCHSITVLISTAVELAAYASGGQSSSVIVSI